MRKFDAILLAVILAVAAALRLWAPWDDVLGGSRVNFLETDSWYHVRLAESQVRNFPHRITVDPYAAPNGQYVAVAPLLDAIIATIAVVLHGRDASTNDIERVAAFVPAIAGVLAVAAVWALATVAFGRRAGLIAGLLSAVLPGHFLDRTLIGFVDHHALEVLFSIGTLAFIASGSAIGSGLCLGLYLLTWASGAYFVFILAVWLLVTALIAPASRSAAARLVAIGGGVALAIVLGFQDPGLYRYGTQVTALVGLVVVAVTVMSFADHLAKAMAVVAVTAVAAAAIMWMFTPGLVSETLTDLNRFGLDKTRMAVLEARPLFLYSGNWTWLQPWVFFRSGFYVGLVAVAGLAVATWRSRRADHLLILCFTVANYLATLGQNRFGYYLVPATAVVIGWLVVKVLDWGGVPHRDNPNPHRKSLLPFQREIAVVIVAGAVVAPNLMPAALATNRAGGMPQYWFDAMQWLRINTPEPFGSPDFYYARYSRVETPASFTVLSWWDQGYWITQTARRVPISNPTQSGADKAARFLTATDEATALGGLAADRVKYVVVDWELPFRDGIDGSLAGRFQNLADWAGTPTDHFYSLCYSRRTIGEPWKVTWIYREPYYQTMAYRLVVLGGGAAQPANNSYVVHIQDHTDVNGRDFCEITDRWQFATPDAAKAAASQRGAGYEAVGLTPWQPAFSTPAMIRLKVASEFRDSSQSVSESPMVRIFEVTPPGAPSPDR
ncbi:MAG: STT3 domain-containing protein [Vicinamibacterales bacterium]